MSRILVLFVLIVARGSGACADDSTTETVRTTPVGYHAEVELSFAGSTCHGRVIVTIDGCVHLEIVDEQTRRWATGVIRRAASPSRGWDSRTDPVRTVWCELGPSAALAEIQTVNASIKMTRHQALPSR